MSKKLVAYFSASGTTKKAAERLAKATGADLFEIKPKVPYSSADLNWMDKKSRSSVEMSDPSSRPELPRRFPIWRTTTRCSLASPSGGMLRPVLSTPLWRAMTLPERLWCPLPPPAAAAWEERWMNCENSARMRIGKPVKW